VTTRGVATLMLVYRADSAEPNRGALGAATRPRSHHLLRSRLSAGVNQQGSRLAMPEFFNGIRHKQTPL
jgi:hypothetical protein